MFQSTYLYKIRRTCIGLQQFGFGFNPRTSIRYDVGFSKRDAAFKSFNPRTSIRYDLRWLAALFVIPKFQSTYLYKIRLYIPKRSSGNSSFNPRTSIRYDDFKAICGLTNYGFNPRTSIRYDFSINSKAFNISSFNPRTSIRYDIT